MFILVFVLVFVLVFIPVFIPVFVLVFILVFILVASPTCGVSPFMGIPFCFINVCELCKKHVAPFPVFTYYCTLHYRVVS